MARDERETTRESETIPEIDFGELTKRFVGLEEDYRKHRHTESNAQSVGGSAWESGFAPGDFHGFKGVVVIEPAIPGGEAALKVFDDGQLLLSYLGLVNEDSLDSNLGTTNLKISTPGDFTTSFGRFSFNDIASPGRLILEIEQILATPTWQYEWRPDVFTQRDSYDNAVVHMSPKHFDGMRLSHTSASVVTIGVGQCRDSTDSRFIVVDTPITADMTVSGAGGIQSGSSETADTWYEVRLIADINGVNAVDSLLTPAGTGLSLPTGYNSSRRVGMIRNDSSSNVIEFVQFGEGRQRRYHWILAFASKFVLTAGTATVATTVNLAALVPPTSTEAYLTFLNDGNRAATVARVAADPSPTLAAVGAELVTRFPTSATQTISYFHPVGGGSRDFNIIVDGFYEDL